MALACWSSQDYIEKMRTGVQLSPRQDDDVRAAGNLKCHLLPVVGNICTTQPAFRHSMAVPLSTYV